MRGRALPRVDAALLAASVLLGALWATSLTTSAQCPFQSSCPDPITGGPDSCTYHHSQFMVTGGSCTGNSCCDWYICWYEDEVGNCGSDDKDDCSGSPTGCLFD